jgi:glutamine synthetase
MHVTLSLNDSEGLNLFYDPDDKKELSQLARHPIAGLLVHHEALTALCAPTVNSYKRLFSGQLSGYWANWGYDHRSVAVRVPSDRGNGTRIESRLADGSANPYLATAALLQAYQLGIVGELDPPPPEEGDGLEKGNTERCCPENLSMALDALEADMNLVAVVGPAIVSHFVAMKRVEWARFSRTVTDWELNEYLSHH